MAKLPNVTRRLCKSLKIDGEIFILCACPFAAILLQSVFSFYYIKVFLNLYRLDQAWFDWGQILYMIWNTVNDPIFGCLQNPKNLNSWFRKRRKIILYGGPIYAASFLLPWFNWTKLLYTSSPEIEKWLKGLHFIVSLFIYDGLFSFVLLAWCSLFTEFSTNPTKRIRAIKYIQIAGIGGVLAVPLVEKISKSLSDFAAFQATCSVLALAASICFCFTGKFVNKKVAQCIEANSDSQDRPADKTDHDNIHIFRQILFDWDFLCYVFTNFFFIFRLTAQANFTAMFTEHLIPETLLQKGSWQISVFYGALVVLPQLLTLLSTPLATKFGPYRLLMVSFLLSVICGCIMGLIGRSVPAFIMIFMLFDATCVGTISPLTTVLCADIVDADMRKHNRKSPASSIACGLNALVTKPAMSLAPLIIVFFLNLAGYEKTKIQKPYNSMEPAAFSLDNATLMLAHNYTSTLENNVSDTMFLFIWLLPVVLGFLQMLIFCKYSLTRTHIVKAK